jgi:hypothetical protein
VKPVRSGAGDREAARHELTKILCTDPRNVAAWALLAPLLENSDRQADCYRRILAVDPDNGHAVERLRQLAAEPSASESPQAPSLPEAGVPLRCPQCGGTMEVRFVGELRDKRAVCLYCGTAVDLPDTYRRVTHERELEENGWGTRIVEKAESQTRSDHLAGDPRSVQQAIRQALDDLARGVEGHSGEIVVTQENLLGKGTPRRAVLTSEEIEGLSDDGLVEWFKERGIDLDAPQGLSPGEQVTVRRVVRETDSRTGVLSLRGLLGGRKGDDKRSPRRELLGPDEIIALAGGALPPEERRACPKCGATIPRDAARCEWCGVRLSGGGERTLPTGGSEHAEEDAD